MVESFIDSLKNFMIDEFVEEPDEKKFENPQLRLSFNCEEGQENTLVVARKSKEDTSIFIKSASEPYQYKVSEYQIKRLTNELEDLKEVPSPPAQEKPDLKEKAEDTSLSEKPGDKSSSEKE